MSDERRIMDDQIVIGLRKARALIESPDKWAAWPPGCTHYNGNRRCAETAITTSSDFPMWGVLIYALKAALPDDYIRVAAYNDTHTHAEVLALFDRAIAMRRHAGLRVRFNERGRRLCGRPVARDRAGTVVRETRNGVQWFIRWDGQQRAYPVDKRLIENA